MNVNHTSPVTDQPALEEPQARWETMLIKVYLRTRGHTLQSLQKLPAEEARRLRIEASIFASTKLAEIETRERMLHELHGVSKS